ncbi:MAG: hypothetical protein KGD57_03775, partial [Candidatus Lokiarchaeota archaeon]|nr:hypothetical protein [Candidatus Lokiarchaeota archaeon]
YSIVNNIGLPYIFRCPQCSAILKLDKDFVDMILEEKSESKTIQSEEESISEELILDESVEQEVPKIVQKKVKVGGFFGKEITVNAVTSNNNNVINEDKMSITTLKPPRARSSIQLCSICGTTVKESHICPVCGSKIS